MAAQKNLLDTLPEWLPREAWMAFLEMRRKTHKPLTDYGLKLAIKRLAKLKAGGHDPQEVLDHSVLNCYQGLFPPETNGNGHARQSWEEKKDADLKSAIARGTEQANRSLGKVVR